MHSLVSIHESSWKRALTPLTLIARLRLRHSTAFEARTMHARSGRSCPYLTPSTPSGLRAGSPSCINPTSRSEVMARSRGFTGGTRRLTTAPGSWAIASARTARPNARGRCCGRSCGSGIGPLKGNLRPLAPAAPATAFAVCCGDTHRPHSGPGRERPRWHRPPPWWQPALPARWFPSTADGQRVRAAWIDAPSDQARWRLGNGFPTRADAAHAREHVREAFRRLRSPAAPEQTSHQRTWASMAPMARESP